MIRLSARHAARVPLFAGCGPLLLPLAAGVAGAQSTVGPSKPGPVVVALEGRNVLPFALPGPGWSNLFFEGDSTRERAAPFAEVAHGRRLALVERRGADGQPTYTVRASGDSAAGPADTAGARPLAFAPFAVAGFSGGRCATAQVPLDGAGATARLQVAFADRYVYGRIAEYRVGTFPTTRGPARVEARPLSRGALRFDDLTALDLFIAPAGEGAVRRETALDSAGRLRFGAAVRGGVFALEGSDRYTVDSVAAGGGRLYLRRVGAVAAPARGFRAPAFAGAALDGTLYRLAGRPGRLTVIEFWSTECPFSERARPEANRLAEAVQARGGTYLMAAREADTATVRAHLAQHPRRGVVLVRDSATWRVWNPLPMTPLYYVIAPDGTVLLREQGAPAVRLAAAAAGVAPQELGAPALRSGAGREARRWPARGLTAAAQRGVEADKAGRASSAVWAQRGRLCS